MQTEHVLKDKRIVLGVTGSIAAYKAATIASHLTQMGALVDVIMTEAAVRFITPVTFQALTGRPVYTDMWQADFGGGMGTHIAHVGLGHSADLLLVAPATANTIARLAHGLADDLLSVTALAADCPVVIAPAMDVGMYQAAATQDNVALLIARGAHFAGPTVGRMASGLEGAGRFLEPDAIIGRARWVLGRNGVLKGRRVVISAGPTREFLDPVRFLSNRSSGKQGFALAQAAIDAGADVALITGPVGLDSPVGAEIVQVVSAREMEAAVLRHATGEHRADVLIMSAAVADYRPAQIEEQKIKKSGAELDAVPLAPNPDILMRVAEQPERPQAVIGFAAESEDVVKSAQEKLVRKNLDLIVANDISCMDAGFGVDTNQIQLITREGQTALPLMSKEEAARYIIGWAAGFLSG